MRMTLWFESLRRQFGSMAGAKSRRHGSGWTRQLTPAFAESLEDRCLLAAGDLDLSFGVAGRVTTDVGEDAGGVTAVGAIQSDGKIVVAGTAYHSGNYDFAVVRYNSDGTLDTSFDGDGKLTTDFGTSDDFIYSVAVQADAKILVAGRSGNTNVALARYNSDGSLDVTFDGDGKLTTASFTTGPTEISMALQGDGKIVIAAASDGNFVVARYNNNGSLDTSFDGDGKVTTDLGFSNFVDSVAVQADGKIVVAGNNNNGSNSDWALVRYNSDGTLDTSFDGDGKLITAFGTGNASAKDVALQVDGKIVVAGYSAPSGGNGNFALARYNSDGSLDLTFDGDGKLTTLFGIRNDYAIQIALQSDGKIVAATTPQFRGSFAVLRFNADGLLDLTFGPTGTVTTDFDLSLNASANSVALQSDGKIVVAGLSNYDFAVARYFAGEQPPEFTSASAVDVAENQTNTLTITATDFKDRLLTYGITGGADQAKFAINSFTGALSFVAAPDFENPTDSNHDNDYEVQVAASNGTILGQQTIAVTVTDTNEAPAITSASSVNVAENTTAVLTVSGTDPEHGALTYSLAGGADDSLFSLNLTTGALAFLAAPNFESPQDNDHSNVHDVRVSVSDGTNTFTQDIHVTVTNVDETPSITSANAASVLENTTSVQTVTASDPEGHSPLFGITGGADQSKFSLNFLTGALSFVSPPDFEHPADANLDNAYEVQVAVSDGTHLVTQNLTVTVTDIAIAPVNEAPVITGPPFANSSQRPVISWTAVTGATEYEIWVTKDHSPNQYHGATVTQTSYTPPVDFGIGKFNLWVRAKNSETIGPWTPKYTFVINTATVLHGITRFQPTLRPTINWDVLPGAVKYDVWINDVSRGITQHIRNSNVTGTTFTPSADLPLGIYRAWVRGIAADGTAASWSAAVEFVTMLAPTITQGQNPTFNRTPTFAWDDLPGAAKYEVFIRNRNTGATTINQTNITGLSFTPSIPIADGPYRWWAIGVSAQGVRSFWTTPMDIYIGGRTDLLSPAGSSNEATPTFEWRPVDGAVRYDLWVNQVGGQAQIIRQQNLTGTNYTPITSLPTGSYRAWIRAVSSTGEVSPWSLEVAFTITAIAPRGGSESPDGIPDVLLAVLPKELQVKNLGSNTTRSARCSIDTREIQPEERIPKIDGRDWASMPTYTDVRSERFDDNLLIIAAIHEFLEGTCL